MRLRRLATALTALALPLALASCSDDPEPIFADPTPSETATGSTPPDVVDSTAPPDKPESAEAFVRRWQTASTEMQRDGDTTEFLALSEGCVACEQFASQVSEIYSTGGRISLGEANFSAFSTIEQGPRGRTVEYVLTSPPSEVISPDGTREPYPGGKERYQLTLTKRAASWNTVSYATVVR